MPRVKSGASSTSPFPPTPARPARRPAASCRSSSDLTGGLLELLHDLGWGDGWREQLPPAQKLHEVDGAALVCINGHPQLPKAAFGKIVLVLHLQQAVQHLPELPLVKLAGSVPIDGIKQPLQFVQLNEVNPVPAGEFPNFDLMLGKELFLGEHVGEVEVQVLLRGLHLPLVTHIQNLAVLRVLPQQLDHRGLGPENRLPEDGEQHLGALAPAASALARLCCLGLQIPGTPHTGIRSLLAPVSETDCHCRRHQCLQEPSSGVPQLMPVAHRSIPRLLPPPLVLLAALPFERPDHALQHLPALSGDLRRSRRQ
mmetsp:Transcript_74550/g.198840  ORF Transcript_74550/g.198840 Transcript_74550/m.198840 type:complete len:312 (+) Transcript_74550:361-1296(+)